MNRCPHLHLHRFHGVCESRRVISGAVVPTPSGSAGATLAVFGRRHRRALSLSVARSRRCTTTTSHTGSDQFAVTAMFGHLRGTPSATRDSVLLRHWTSARLRVTPVGSLRLAVDDDEREGRGRCSFSSYGCAHLRESVASASPLLPLPRPRWSADLVPLGPDRQAGRSSSNCSLQLRWHALSRSVSFPLRIQLVAASCQPTVVICMRSRMFLCLQSSPRCPSQSHNEA